MYKCGILTAKSHIAMKLQQLLSIAEVQKNGLNVSQAAQVLHSSQPGISRSIRQLEDELGVEIFERSGKHLVGVTAAGQDILSAAHDILQRVENIKTVADEHKSERQGALSIATTHTQSRYVLPPVIQQFIEQHPEVALHMHQGTPIQIAELAADGTADLAIATEAMEYFDDLLMLPCYTWNRAVLVPKSHPLAQENTLTLENISRYPIVTYTFGFTGRSRLDEAFQARHLSAKVVFTAADADVIKTYVRLGLGVGIVARMAFDPKSDGDLLALDASHLFADSITHVGVKKNKQLRGYMYDFIESFAPHLTRDLVQEVICTKSAAYQSGLLSELKTPSYPVNG